MLVLDAEIDAKVAAEEAMEQERTYIVRHLASTQTLMYRTRESRTPPEDCRGDQVY
jgi:hypothetical protein